MKYLLLFMLFVSLNAENFDNILEKFQTKSDVFFPGKIKQICLEANDEKTALACYMIANLNIKNAKTHMQTAINLSQKKCKTKQYWCEINSILKANQDKGIKIISASLDLKPHKNAILLSKLSQKEKESLSNLILVLSLGNIKKINCLSQRSVTLVLNLLENNSDKVRNFIKKFANTNSDDPKEILNSIIKNFNKTQKENFTTKLNQTQNTLIKLDIIFYYSFYKSRFLVSSECF